jgi:hypothetical protein
MAGELLRVCLGSALLEELEAEAGELRALSLLPRLELC